MAYKNYTIYWEVLVLNYLIKVKIFNIKKKYSLVNLKEYFKGLSVDNKYNLREFTYKIK